MSVVIHSSPASFTITAPVDGGTVQEAVTFAIPVGVYSSGKWDAVGSCSVGPSPHDTLSAVTTGTHSALYGAISGPFTAEWDITAQQLVDVNSAAGGNLNAALSYFSIAHDTLNIPAEPSGRFTLTLEEGSQQPARPLRVFGVVDAEPDTLQAQFIALPKPSIGITRRLPNVQVFVGVPDEETGKAVFWSIPLAETITRRLPNILTVGYTEGSPDIGLFRTTELNNWYMVQPTALRWPRVTFPPTIDEPVGSFTFFRLPSQSFPFPFAPRTFLPLRIRKALGRTGR